MTKQLLSRLKLTSDKLATLVKGIRSLAGQEDPIGKVLSKTELAEDLILQKISCPIGEILVKADTRY
jgi:delta-1-pyrroline-5-carboxylate synthetase